MEPEKPPSDREEDEEPEFEDEPPGAILFELRPRPGLAIWGALNFIGLAVLGLLVLLLEPAPGDPSRLPLGILWILLPVSAVIGIVTTTFMRLNLPAGAPPNAIASWAFRLQLLTLLGWTALAWGARAGF